MDRGITWVDRIVITKDEVTKKPNIEVSGLWNGRDRLMIGRMLYREMRKSTRKIVLEHKQADQVAKEAGIPTKGEIKDKRIANIAKARLAKKEKRLLEEANKDVRGQ